MEEYNHRKKEKEEENTNIIKKNCSRKNKTKEHWNINRKQEIRYKEKQRQKDKFQEHFIFFIKTIKYVTNKTQLKFTELNVKFTKEK